MTWPTDEAREAVDRAIGAWSIDDAEDREHQTDTILAALTPHVAALVRAERADAWEEGYDVGHRYARGVLPPDESDANPYAEEGGR